MFFLVGSFPLNFFNHLVYYFAPSLLVGLVLLIQVEILLVGSHVHKVIARNVFYYFEGEWLDVLFGVAQPERSGDEERAVSIDWVCHLPLLTI